MFYKLVAKFLSKPKVFNYLLKRAKKTPYCNIYGADNNELYIERYWLFNPYFETKGLRQFKWFPLSLRIHKIVKEDNDRHLHDHPWNARTFILKGWYKEERLYEGWSADFWEGTEIIKRKAGDTARLNFGEYHRITEVPDEGVYTIFITGKYQGTWSFLVEGKGVPYKEYLGLEPKQ